MLEAKFQIRDSELDHVDHIQTIDVDLETLAGMKDKIFQFYALEILEITIMKLTCLVP